ncbi:MAG: hypothetical protein GWP17_00920 [Aquificales bacterium]|nr:hypothetical protein [Aquificales bacterium]
MAAKSKVRNPTILAHFLQNMTVPELKALALLVDSNLPTRKGDVIAVLRQRLENIETLKKLYKQLDERQQTAVAETVHGSNDKYDGRSFTAKYGDTPDWNQPAKRRSYSYHGRGKPTRLRLFFYGYGKIMPVDLKSLLKQFVPRPRAAAIATFKTLDDFTYEYEEFVRDPETFRHTKVIHKEKLAQRHTEYEALHDIQAVLHLINAGNVRVSAKTQRPTAAASKAITKVLVGGDFYDAGIPLESWDKKPIGPIKAFAWPLIVQSAGLASESRGKLALTTAGSKALNAAPEKTLQRAWKRWQKSTLLDEFSRIHTIKGQTGKGKRTMTAVAGRRAVITEALAAVPANEWVEFETFSRYMQAAGHTFEVNRNLWNLYIADAHYGALGYEGYGSWGVVQDRYILAFLFEYAAVMGVIDVGYRLPQDAKHDFGSQWGTDDSSLLSRYDGLLYFRINGLGAWLLGQSDTYVPSPIEEKTVLYVLPNMDIAATEPLTPGDVLFIEQFAIQSGENVYKINKSQLLKTLEQGVPVQQIRDFLTAKSGKPLPQTVDLLLQEAAEGIEQLSYLGTAHLIAVKDPIVAQLIVNRKALSQHCRLAGDSHIVVPDDKMIIFRKTVRELGYGLKQS